jgi:hypothetical protein
VDEENQMDNPANEIATQGHFMDIDSSKIIGNKNSDLSLILNHQQFSEQLCQMSTLQRPRFTKFSCSTHSYEPPR